MEDKSNSFLILVMILPIRENQTILTFANNFDDQFAYSLHKNTYALHIPFLVW